MIELGVVSPGTAVSTSRRVRASKDDSFMLMIDEASLLSRWSTLLSPSVYSHKTTFLTIFAQYGGGIVYANSYTSLVVHSSMFIGNQAIEEGGAIHSSGGNLSVEHSYCCTNSAGVGGSIKLQAGNVSIEYSLFYSNTAVAGGAVQSYAGNVSIEHSFLDHNGARVGGAVYSNAGNVRIKHSFLSYNTAEEFGGAVNVNGSSKSTSLFILLSTKLMKAAKLLMPRCTSKPQELLHTEHS